MKSKKPVKPLDPPRSLYRIRREANKRKEHVARHIASMRCCWPEWEGPKVEDSVHGRCSINECGIHYMAECRIESVSEDGETITVVIDYKRNPYDPDDSQGVNMCARNDNGTRLTLDITEIWPPTRDLWELHYAEDCAERNAAGQRCHCGGLLAGIFSGKYLCQTHYDEAMTNLYAPKPKPKRKTKRKLP
jgi:hypothetical protein